MAEDSNDSELYGDPFFVKVEDKTFCVPRYEFVKSSDVFADMFLLPSGPATRSEGQDRDLPIVLEGYKKDEFASLLKVMYPTATSLISGKKFELHLKKEEWVSVLKLSTIWNMTKIRQYAIHRLSTDVTPVLSPIEKILLARAHGVAAWLDEGVTSFAALDPMPKLEDLATLGWETVARILLIRDNLKNLKTIRFRRDEIHCTQCSSSITSSPGAGYDCEHIASGDAELTTTSESAASPFPGTFDFSVDLKDIQCLICEMNPFYGRTLVCNSCSFAYYYHHPCTVRVRMITRMIKEIFGEEIKDLEPVQNGGDDASILGDSI